MFVYYAFDITYVKFNLVLCARETFVAFILVESRIHLETLP